MRGVTVVPMTGSSLGEYLRARREQILPEDVGLPVGAHRRVPGLRREEVAMLAGISAEYYLRLEQGRDQHPSEQVLDSIAHALQLGADAEVYLHEIARPAPTRRRRMARSERVSASVLTLIEGWELTPALVHGRYLTTLAANRLAVALSPFNAPGLNALRAAFLEPAMQDLYVDWPEMTAKSVAYLRSVIGSDIDDPHLAELVGELSLRSERFRVLWARHDVRQKSSGVSHFAHPVVGELELHYEKLAIPASPGQVLVTYHADPGSPSLEKLRLLATLAE